MGAQSRIKIDLSSIEEATSTAIGTPTRRLPHRLSVDRTVASGTGSQQADVPYSATLTITDTPTLLDVRALTSKLTGSALSMAEVTGIAMKNLSEVSGEYVYIDSGGANPLISPFKASGDGNRLDPLGEFLLTSPIDGFATGASNKTIQLTAATGKTVQVRVWLLGRSA